MIIIKWLLSQGDNLSSGKQNIPRNRLFVRRRPISVDGRCSQLQRQLGFWKEKFTNY